MKIILLSDKIEIIEVKDLDNYIHNWIDLENYETLAPDLKMIYDDGIVDHPINKIATKIVSKIEQRKISYRGNCVIIHVPEDWDYSDETIMDITEEDYNCLLNFINE